MRIVSNKYVLYRLRTQIFLPFAVLAMSGGLSGKIDENNETTINVILEPS